MRIILVVVVFEVALTNFTVAGSTRAMIGYAATMTITLVLMGVIAVQSWVAGTKISLLREIKLLRLECLGRPTGQVVQTDWRDSPMTPSTRRRPFCSGVHRMASSSGGDRRSQRVRHGSVLDLRLALWYGTF